MVASSGAARRAAFCAWARQYPGQSGPLPVSFAAATAAGIKKSPEMQKNTLLPKDPRRLMNPSSGAAMGLSMIPSPGPVP